MSHTGTARSLNVRWDETHEYRTLNVGGMYNSSGIGGTSFLEGRGGEGGGAGVGAGGGAGF